MLQAHKNISQHLKTLQSRTREALQCHWFFSWRSKYPVELQVQCWKLNISHRMRETFQHHQKLDNEPGISFDILLNLNPRIRNSKGSPSSEQTFPKSISSNRNLISSFRKVDHNFTLLFDDETSSRLLQNWDVFFKSNFIKEASWLTSAPESCCLV